MTGLVAATATEFLRQFQRLLPRGVIWHRGWGTVQDEHLLTLMPTWTRLHATANGLIADVFPCTTQGMLPEWEATLGLPDPCIGPLDTLQERVAAVCAKFRSRGGQSVAYFEALAASLGFDVTIEQFEPFRVGHSRVGDPLAGEAWAYAWRVVSSEAVAIVDFRTGLSTVGEPLRAWGNATLECTIEALKPAHTTVVFTYPG